MDMKGVQFRQVSLYIKLHVTDQVIIYMYHCLYVHVCQYLIKVEYNGVSDYQNENLKKS
jgi:hypothetical protein